jgi:uncharacterized protein with HEPN domain
MHPSQIEFLNHILEECDYLEKEVEENDLEDLVHNQRLNRAVCRSLEVIGEAANKIHPDIKQKYNQVAWREMSDLRNRIIHHYFGIDYDIVWNTISDDIPELKIWIKHILNNET